ncbi:13516_t:CDS:2 [Rhizophagus irregularis]|nr:13516_t:CDS:2 [Rhizophagus irregularis]
MNLYDDDNPKKKLKTFEEASEESARTCMRGEEEIVDICLYVIYF